MDIIADDIVSTDKLNILYDKTKYTSFSIRYKEIAPDGSLEYGIKLLLEPRVEGSFAKKNKDHIAWQKKRRKTQVLNLTSV